MKYTSLDDLRGLQPDELRAAIAEIDIELGDLHQTSTGEMRDLSTDEEKRLDDLLRIRQRAHLQIERHDNLRGQYERNPKAVRTAFGGSLVGADNPFDGGDVRMLTKDQARDAALRALEQRGRNLGPDQQDKVNDLLRSKISEENPNVDGSYIAKRTLITESDAYRSAWQQVVTDPHPVLTNEEAAALRSLRTLETEYRAMSIGTDAAGGYGVPVFIDPTVILTGQQSLNPIRRIARNVTVTTDSWKGVTSAGVTWSYDAEASEVSDDTPTLAQPTVDVHMARGWVPFSIEVGMDYPGFAEEMAKLLAAGYDELQAQSFATGSGSGQPFGILTALDANTNVEVVVTTDGTFTGTDINKVWGQLPDRWKGRATWVMSHDAGNEVATFGNSNNLSFVTVDLTGVVSTLRQRPVEFSSYFPDFTGTTGASNILVVGDFSSGYLIADRVGMNVELVPHLLGTTNNRPTGQRGWFAYARHGADSIVDDCFRLLQNQ